MTHVSTPCRQGTDLMSTTSIPSETMTRPARTARQQAGDADVLAVAGPVRRVVAARLDPPADVEDVVQETLTRLWEVRWRLERGALLGYGLAIARNLVTSAERGQRLTGRHAPRLAELDGTDDPEIEALRAEEHAAVHAALAALREPDRDLLVEHEVAGVELGKIAAEHGVTSGAVAARLARARARLRVEHVLAFRRVRLPTPRCRPVLEALSLGDRGRQRVLAAGGHLVECGTCADLAEPLLRRSRALTALAPVALLAALPGRLWAWAWARANPAPAAAGSAATVAVGVAVAVAVAGGSSPAPAPAPAVVTAVAQPPRVPAPAATPVPATLSIGGARVLPAERVGSLRSRAGRTAVARGVPVQAVPADEGFWVGYGPGRRVWVQLASGGESPENVRPGKRASFTGRVRPTDAAFLARVGLGGADLAELRGAGAYILVDPAGMSLR